MNDEIFDSNEKTWWPEDNRREMTNEEFALSIWINIDTWNTVLFEQLRDIYLNIKNKVKSLIFND